MIVARGLGKYVIIGYLAHYRVGAERITGVKALDSCMVMVSAASNKLQGFG